MTTLPVIDISALPDNLSSVSDEISRAFAQCGFFYIRGHGIDPSIIANIRAVQREFFAQSEEAKQRYAINRFNRGYLASGMARMHGAKQHDQKEVFFWGKELPADHPDVVNQTPLCGSNQWPAQPRHFKQAVLAYAEEIMRTGNNLLAAIAVSLGADADFFTRFYTDTMLRGQLIRYPQTTGSSDSFGVAPHSDYGCITLLLQETPGLEVLINRQWVEAPPVPDTLVVNVGDLLERWSDGRLPSTRHRVRNTTPDARYSIAMFHDPSPHAVVDPRDLDASLQRDAMPAVTAAEYIAGRNAGSFSHYGKIDPQSQQ